MNIDPTSSVPIYRQIAYGIRSAVAAGVYQPDEVIPSIRATSLSTGTNPNTVQRAYEFLEREGLIRSRKGLGMFVTTRGAQTAQALSEKAVGKAFFHTIRDALAAGLPANKVTAAFNQAMCEVSKETRSKS